MCFIVLVPESHRCHLTQTESDPRRVHPGRDMSLHGIGCDVNTSHSYLKLCWGPEPAPAVGTIRSLYSVNRGLACLQNPIGVVCLEPTWLEAATSHLFFLGPSSQHQLGAGLSLCGPSLCGPIEPVAGGSMAQHRTAGLLRHWSIGSPQNFVVDCIVRVSVSILGGPSLVLVVKLSSQTVPPNVP
jgi:hypothetical protein